MEHVIVIGPTGGVKAMHSDKFPLGFLGRQRVERASDIRFDEETQKWGIWFNVDGEFVAPRQPRHAGHDTYEGARGYEVFLVNQALAMGVCPTTIN